MNTRTTTTGWCLAALLFVLVAAGGCSTAAISASSGSRSIERRAPLPAPEATAIAGETLAGLSTTEQLAVALPPQRDLRRLASQLDPMLKDVPLTVRGEPPAYAIGDQQPFWVRNTSTNRVAEISATLIYSTPVVYIWVESGQEYDQQALEHSADRFSAVTYPKVVNTFGSEWRPGVDNDARLHILYNTKMGSGVSGYFSGADEYTQPVVPFSNQKEMFYINLAALKNPSTYAGHDRTLAHELQHMVHWHMDRSEDLWLNEGLSEYAQEVAEFSAGAAFAGAFAADPDVQLTTWGAIGGNRPHYGSAYLFMVYLAQRFGREAITKLVADPANGLQSVTDALASVGAGIDAEQLFADWVVANYAGQPDALGESGRYGYTGIRAPSFVPAAQHAAYPVPPQQATVANFAADYIELGSEGNSRGDVTFSFAGATETKLADMALETGERAWWSNRADSADARLLARYDLIGIAPGAPLTLTAAMWWDIETNYDFGYVTASSDGEHWRILPGQHTATSDPSGNAFGAGYTGRSADNPDDAPAWVDESFDLSAFAGGPLWLELRYITDDGVNAPGWWVDNLQLAGPNGPVDPLTDSPAEGTSADSEGAGWQSYGWLLTDNRLPQRWLLQVLEFDGDTLSAVRRVPVDAEGRAEVKIEGLGNSRRAVVAVSGLSPVTTLPAQYEYAITAAGSQ